MIKVLMLITSLANGGAERVVSELSLNLSPNVQRRIVLLTNEISYPYNVTPISMNFKLGGTTVIKMIYGALFGIINYVNILKRYKPDVSISFLVLDNFINILSNIGNKKTKVIVSVHIALSMKFRKSIIDRLAKLIIMILYNKADLVIAVSKGVRNELIRDFKIDQKKIKILYNPIDIENIQYLAKAEVDDEWFNGNIPIIMNMGRLTVPKGQWHLIRAFSKVRARKKSKLIILGNGDLEQYLKKLVMELDLTDDVYFMGWKDNPFKYISKASIYVSSSLWEALPCAIIEAMACGCPIVATDCKYGPSEILENGKFGILTPPLDGTFHKASDKLTPEEEYLADEISRLLENEEFRKAYSEKAKKRAIKYDKKNAIKAYQHTIKKIVDPK